MKNLSLNVKIALLVAMLVTAGAIISWIGINNMNSLNNSLNEIVDTRADRVIRAERIDVDLTDIRGQQFFFILEDKVEEMNKIGANIDELYKAVRTQITDYKKIATEAGLKDMETIEKLLDEWKPVDLQMRNLSLANKNAEAKALATGKSKEILMNVDSVLEGVKTRNKKFMKEVADATDVQYADARNLIYIVSIVALLVSVFTSFVLLRSLGGAIDRVIANLTESSNQLTSASQQISASSEQLSQGATEQAASLEETSSAIEEMNSMVKKNADTARQSTDISQTSGNSAARGKRVVEEMKVAMVDIDAANGNIMRQTTESNQKISDIVKVISEIGNKTKVINEIVFQTKLLSFNASVEAARAGEHGKGFAVVAEEVGKLAEMSGSAAKDITSMLDSSIQKVEGIVHETKSSIEKLITESKAKVELGTKVAINCGEVLDEIVTNVTQVAQMSQSISTATDEQSRGIGEITKSVAQLDQMTQQNAAAAEETASAAEELSAQAVNMQGVVQALIQTVKGGEQATGQSHQQTTTYTSARVSSTQDKNVGRVIHLGNKRKAPLPMKNEHPMKMASGGESIPSDGDPRFKNV